MSCYTHKGKKELVESRFSSKTFWWYCVCMGQECLDFLGDHQKVAYKSYFTAYLKALVQRREQERDCTLPHIS